MPSVPILETDSQMEMCVQELWGGVCTQEHRGLKIVLQGPSVLSLKLIPQNNISQGRRETNLEGGSFPAEGSSQRGTRQ